MKKIIVIVLIALCFAGSTFTQNNDMNAASVVETTYILPKLGMEDKFEAAIKAGTSTLMTAFHEIDGIPSTANPKLLIDILRKRWGFEGVVVSDEYSG